MTEAPPDWYYHLFPLEAPGQEALSLDSVVRRSHALINQAKAEDDQAPMGPVLHWAHLLKIEQGATGDWPARVNARTGEHLGSERTRSPLSLLARLNAILQSTEFDMCLALARENPPPRPS